MKPVGIRGLVAAVHTPMHPDGELNLGLVPRIVAHLERNPLVGVYVAGSTGEGVSLTDDERQAVVEAYSEAVGGRLPVLVQVGHNSLKAAAQLAGHAESIGAAGISATPAGYYKPANEAGLVEAMLQVAEGAPNTPFYYYHIPWLSGVEINLRRFTELAMERIPTFCGMKQSDVSTFRHLQGLRDLEPDLEFLAGSDEDYLQALALGYEGAVGGTFSYASPLYAKVREEFIGGNLEGARLWQKRAVSMTNVMFATCGYASLKVMMRMIGIDCGAVRRPIEPATESKVAALQRGLEEIGWFEWIGMEAAVALA